MLKFIALVSLLAASAPSLACSVSVNNKFMKNDMIVAAVNQHGLSLDGATSSIEGYTKTFLGASRVTGCPVKVQTRGHVVIHYTTEAGASCVFSANVTRTSALGPLATPTFSFADGGSECVL